MIVVVTGGRDYNDRGAVWYALTQLNNKHPITELIEGEASGVVFPGGRGTADMHRRMLKAGLTVWVPYG